MTGIPVRVQRDGRWMNLDVTELTNEELTQHFSAMSAKEAARWAIALACWIRDNVRVTSA